MSFPPIYTVTYSYTGFAAGLGDGSFPGTQLDADITGLQDSIVGLSDFIKDVFTSEGVLQISALPGATDLTSYTEQALEAADTATQKATAAQDYAAAAYSSAEAASEDANTAESSAQTASDMAAMALGVFSSSVWAQCRLNFVSTSEIRLDRHDGALISIDGEPRVIPETGPSLAPDDLTPGTTYYVYAYWTGTEIALEAATTAPAIAASGQKIKTGDETRALVGMVNPDTGPNFADTVTNRRVLSYYNRRPKNVLSGFTANRTTTSTTFAEINSENRVTFLSWGDADERFALNGWQSHSVASNSVLSALCLDTIGAQLATSLAVTAGSAALSYEPSGTAITAGLHTLLYGGRVNSAGTGTYGVINEIRGQIRG